MGIGYGKQMTGRTNTRRRFAQFEGFTCILCKGRLTFSHTTAKEWLTLLEASYIVFLLEPYYLNISKRLVKSPKLYFFDIGLASYLLGIENISHVENHPLRGNLFENLVLMEILKFRYNQGKRNNLNFYRDSRGNEVDIIYRVGQHILPIEVKAGETVAADFFKGLRVFDKAVPELPFGKAVIYGGDRVETRHDTKICRVMDIPELLEQMA
ncbi:MAG: ATP-binding protein [bacterium]